jgi:predicted metal-dependent phosphoesterase TrpH
MAVLKAPLMVDGRPIAQDLASLRQVFASIHAESCPHTYNFHMHTNHSDGQLQPEMLAQQALELGLVGFAITDHHQITGFYQAAEYLRQWQERSANSAPLDQADKPMPQLIPHLWTGLEVTSSLLDVEVHILGYAFDPHHAAIAPYLVGTAPSGAAAEAAQVISALHQAGGLAVLAHPARYRKTKEELIPAAVGVGIDGVETYYAYSNPKPWRPTAIETTEVIELSRRYHLLNTCGTDTHGLSLEQRV